MERKGKYTHKTPKPSFLAKSRALSIKGFVQPWGDSGESKYSPPPALGPHVPGHEGEIFCRWLRNSPARNNNLETKSPLFAGFAAHSWGRGERACAAAFWNITLEHHQNLCDPISSLQRYLPLTLWIPLHFYQSKIIAWLFFLHSVHCCFSLQWLEDAEIERSRRI